jgi:hypothetical protein
VIAAVYARKSTDQSAVADEAKSVTRQIDHATAYAIGKGWTVPEACIFVDDGISGAEFANRPGFVRLMAALKPRPPFHVLVMSEESRLGREAIETAYALSPTRCSGRRKPDMSAAAGSSGTYGAGLHADHEASQRRRLPCPTAPAGAPRWLGAFDRARRAPPRAVPRGDGLEPDPQA